MADPDEIKKSENLKDVRDRLYQSFDIVCNTCESECRGRLMAEYAQAVGLIGSSIAAVEAEIREQETLER